MRKARGVDACSCAVIFPWFCSTRSGRFVTAVLGVGWPRCWLAVSYPGLGDAPTGRLRYAVLAGLSGQTEVLQLPGLSPVRGPALVAAVVAF